MFKGIKILFIITILVFCNKFAFAQSKAGQEGFAILNLYNSAPMTAKGLNFVPRFIEDAPTSIANPATLNPTLNNRISLTYTDIFAGSYQGAIHYTRTFEKFGNFGFALQYINYGEFLLTEENGDVMGTFSAHDYMFNIAWGKQIENNIYLGINFKPMFSKYESYSSTTLAVDVSAMWSSPSKSWQIGAVLKNIGRQVQSFANQRDTLPLDLQIGVSKKFKHAPIVLYIVADNLTQWDIRGDDALNPRTSKELDGSETTESSFSAFMDKGFRHLRFAIDILPSKYLNLSLGYSYRQRKEMAVTDAFSLTGLSYGFQVFYKNYTIAYARSEYHNYGSPNYITLSYKF
ncbi:MAG: type IX secretion system protein PorQ [Bacteroidota bacterium]|nr:type IX secretion system protein PorQ [Bacteroidota bacterium]